MVAMSSSEVDVLRVLILDDEARVLRTLAGYLRAPHLEIVTCSEIEAAECLLDRQHFDLLITDLEVSDLGGLEGIRLIRHAAVHFPELEVVVFSGKLDQRVRAIGEALGVKDHFAKPTDLSRLRDLVDRDDRVVREADGGKVIRVPTLDEVLGRRQISAVLQPIVALAPPAGGFSGIGIEGLARGPSGSALANPEILLGYASKKERLFETELQCLEAVLLQARHLPSAVKLFLNVQPRSLSTPGFAAALGNLVRRFGRDQRDVVLELTEQQSILNLGAFNSTLQALRNHGFGLALDDFGRGFANLDLVHRLPLDYLKIDGVFSRGIDTDPRKRAIVQFVLAAARDLGIATVMEHVETASELEVVTQLGACYAQGYYLSRPLPGRELAGQVVLLDSGETAQDVPGEDSARSAETGWPERASFEWARGEQAWRREDDEGASQ